MNPHLPTALILFSAAAMPAWGDELGPGPDEQPEQQRDDVDEIEEQIRRLLAQRQAEVDAQERAQAWRDGAIKIRGKWVKVEAYTDPLADKDRAEVVALLNAPSFEQREQAETHLLADDTLDREALRGLIQGAKTDEQRHRLLRVAEHHVMREVREREFGQAKPELVDELDGPIRFEPRESAAIGFSYMPMLAEDSQQTDLPAVTVTATMPGFPGHALLRPGDLVVAVNGQNARDIRHRELITSWMSRRIGFQSAGDTIVLTVIRGDRALDIKIVCAEGRALDAMYSSNGRDAAFRERPYAEKWLNAREELAAGLPAPKVLKPAGE